MPHPAIVVILVAATEAHDPTTVAMTRATRDALGPDAVVIVQESSATPTTAEAATIGTKVHADAVAALTWTLADRRSAHIAVVLPDGRIVDRDLTFTANDADAERGRAIGLAVVALIPEPAPDPTPVAETATPRPVPPPPSVVHPLVVEAPAPRTKIGIELFGVAATAPIAVGGGIGLRYLSALSPRIAASTRMARIDDASLRTLDAVLGIAPTFDSRTTRWGGRLELGVMQQSVALRDERRSRTIPFGRALAEVSLWPSTSLGVGLAAGVELAFGETQILQGDARVATVPRARFIVEFVVRTAL